MDQRDIDTIAAQLVALSRQDRDKVEDAERLARSLRPRAEAKAAAEAQGGGFRCPSRDNNPLADSSFPHADHWRTEANGDRTCSFCGSTHPDDAKEAMAAYADTGAGHFSTSDKSYKVYINRAGVQNAGQGGIKFYTWHTRPEDVDAISDLYKQCCGRKRVRLEVVREDP